MAPPIDYDSAVHALKTGIAVVLASLLAICDPIYSFTATGGWAVVTVIVLSQRTVGATMLKFTERTLGTAAAAAAASICGLAVDRYLPDFWQPLAVAGLLFVVTVYCIYRADTGSWTYAYTMTALTFNFLLLLCYRQRAGGARRAIAHDCHRRSHPSSSRAPPQLGEKARPCSPNPSRTPRAHPNRRRRRRLGRQLHRFKVELAPAALDDEIHVAYRQVVLARTTIDEATRRRRGRRGCAAPRRLGAAQGARQAAAPDDLRRHVDRRLPSRRPAAPLATFGGFRRTLAPRLLAATERMAAVLATFATAVKTLDGVEADRVAAGAGLEAMEQSLALLRKGLRVRGGGVAGGRTGRRLAAAAVAGGRRGRRGRRHLGVPIRHVGRRRAAPPQRRRRHRQRCDGDGASRQSATEQRRARGAAKDAQAIAARRHPTTTAMV